MLREAGPVCRSRLGDGGVRWHAGMDGPQGAGARWGRTCCEGFQALGAVHWRWATT